MSTGRFWVVVDGRKFLVEPIHERNQKENDVAFTNGGISGTGTKNNPLGGSVPREDSVITKENGFTNIWEIGPGQSPIGFIEALVARDKENQ